MSSKRYLIKVSLEIVLLVVVFIATAIFLNNIAVRPSQPATVFPTQTARVEYVVVTATPAPTPERLGEVSAESITVIARRGETVKNVLTVQSVNAIGWGVYGYPCPELKGAHWEPASGGLSPGDESFVWVEIDDSSQTGTCEGKIVITFLSKEDKIEKHTIKLKFTILP